MIEMFFVSDDVALCTATNPSMSTSLLVDAKLVPTSLSVSPIPTVVGVTLVNPGAGLTTVNSTPLLKSLLFLTAAVCAPV